MWARIWALLDWCFFGPASARAGLWRTALRLLRYPYAVVRDLARGEINLRAMGLVYTTLLSLIPLLAFSLSILKIFGGHRDIEPIVYEFFRPVGGAAATELTDRVVQFAHRVSSGVVGSLGLALLAWTLVGTIKKVEDSFNFLWHVDQPRSLARRVAEYTTLLIAGPVLLVAFVGCVARRARQRAGAGDGAPAAAAAPARHRHQPRPLRDGDGVLHRALHADPQHARALARRAHRRARRRRAVGGDRQDVHRVGGLFHAPDHCVRRVCLHRGGAAMDLLRLADPARRRAAVVLRAEPGLPAARPAAAAAVERGARAARTQAHVLRRTLARGRRAALEREPRGRRARPPRHRRGADGGNARARADS